MRKFLLFNLFFSLQINLWAQPANDLCSGAFALTSNTTCNFTAGTSSGATDNNETGDCTSGTEKAVWFKFTSTQATATITVDGAVGYDAVVGVNSACGSASITCTDDTFDGEVETVGLTGLTIGITYYIQVYDWEGDATAASTFDICVVQVAPPDNNNPCDASLLANGTPGSLTGTTVNSTNSTVANQACDGFTNPNGDVWYKITTDGDGVAGENLTITCDPTGSQDFAIYLYSGTCSSLTYVTCKDTGVDGDTETLTYVVPSDFGDLFVRVKQWGPSTGTFTISASGPSLPIDIKTIKAHNEGNQNLITWTTASETNNDVQMVERSKDGRSGWEMVGKVAGTNKSQEVTYEVIDENPLNISYYRLHSIDFDGREQFSKIVSVRRDGIKGGRINAIYPNPAKHQLTADLQSDTDGDAVITISDITGKVMTTSKTYLKEGINNHQSDLTSLPSGMYILKVEGAGINEFKKFVKE